MDKRFLCTLAAVLAVCGGSALLVSRLEPPVTAPLNETISGVEQPTEEVDTAPETEHHNEYAYIIREYEGRVAVFRAENDSEPEMVLDTLVKYLPDYDRSQLYQGIPVRDYSELVAIIEDFVS